MNTYSAKILGTGHCLPDRVLSNRDIEKMVETNDQWIYERTGIRERRIAAAHETTTDFALLASQRALKNAKLSASDIEMIIFATCTPDTWLPNAACVLQQKLAAPACVAWDLNAACSGFLYGLSVANQYIKSGLYKNILVIGAETLSRITNFKDRETCILFGDGAGAFVMGRSEGDSAILAESLVADGQLNDLLVTPGGGAKLPLTAENIGDGLQYVSMKGREIFRNAVRTMAKTSQDVLSASGLKPDEITWVVPHQANQRIIEAVAKLVNLPMEKFISNVERVGNTSSASVPIAFDEAVSDGRIKRGDVILTTVFGAGLTSGAILFRY